jgi:putative hydrolase of the HAD superfamily
MASERGPHKGLLVDYGGVLTTDLFDSFRAFCEVEGLEPEAIGQSFRRDPSCRELLIGLETGTLEEDQFELRFAEILGVSAPGLIERLMADSRPNDKMVAAVASARSQGIRTGLISNSWGTRRYDRAHLAELFDGVVISGEVGIRKPAPEIYELGSREIGLEPGDCVFVDDLPFNLAPAAELGMATVHHTAAAETISELEQLLDVRLK